MFNPLSWSNKPINGFLSFFLIYRCYNEQPIHKIKHDHDGLEVYVGRVWDRLFDHKGFLSGEISFMLREFEQKRKDKEVDTLFRVIEDITEIKDTEIDRLKQVNNRAEIINKDLNQALDVCNTFSELEKRIKQDTTIEDTRLERKIVWERFMDGITTKYSEINSTFEAKEEVLVKLYEDIEKKLLI